MDIDRGIPFYGRINFKRVRLKLDVVVCCYLKDNGLLFCNVDVFDGM
jgi:hypothetical protein